MLNYFRSIIPERHFLRLFYHKILSFFAAVYYGFPCGKMIVIGVTGTNGKTTTVNLITEILNATGAKVGMTSTINFQVCNEKWTNISKQTTLGPFFLQKMLKRMENEGCKYAVIEVTSHALDQSRIFGINFDVAVITNVTPDHVEYHGSFNAYLNSKGQLFKKVAYSRKKPAVPKIIVLNTDDQYYTFFDQFPADRKITYGFKNAIVSASDITKEAGGSRFVIHLPNTVLPVKINLPGDYNIANVLAATAVCMGLNVSTDLIKGALENCKGIPGRFENVYAGQKFSVVVDYAHTPDALESLLALYKTVTQGRLFAVFGATGGGRDKGKRPEMGRIGDKYADYLILTDDDPYEEDEWGIIDQLAEGVSRKEGKNFWKIPDRREAIRLALSLAKENDTVVVSGKGAEEVIKLRGKTVPWNDKKVITELLSREVKIAL